MCFFERGLLFRGKGLWKGKGMHRLIKGRLVNNLSRSRPPPFFLTVLLRQLVTTTTDHHYTYIDALEPRYGSFVFRTRFFFYFSYRSFDETRSRPVPPPFFFWGERGGVQGVEEMVVFRWQLLKKRFVCVFV